MDDDRYTRITLRLPKDLHAQLQESADETSKSMNAEIIARLEQSFGEAPTHLSDRHIQQIEQYAAASRVTFDEALHMLINAGLHPGAPLVVVLHLDDGMELSKLHEALDTVMEKVPKKSVASVQMPTKVKSKKDRA